MTWVSHYITFLGQKKNKANNILCSTYTQDSQNDRDSEACKVFDDIHGGVIVTALWVFITLNYIKLISFWLQ